MTQDIANSESLIRKLTALSLVAPWLLVAAVSAEGFIDWLNGGEATSTTLAFGSLNVLFVSACALIVLFRVAFARTPKRWELRLFIVIISVTGFAVWTWTVWSAMSYFFLA